MNSGKGNSTRDGSLIDYWLNRWVTVRYVGGPEHINLTNQEDEMFLLGYSTWGIEVATRTAPEEPFLIPWGAVLSVKGSVTEEMGRDKMTPYTRAGLVPMPDPEELTALLNEDRTPLQELAEAVPRGRARRPTSHPHPPPSRRTLPPRAGVARGRYRRPKPCSRTGSPRPTWPPAYTVRSEPAPHLVPPVLLPEGPLLQTSSLPPSTCSTVPVTKPLPARNMNASAMSSGVPILPTGSRAASSSTASSRPSS